MKTCRLKFPWVLLLLLTLFFSLSASIIKGQDIGTEHAQNHAFQIGPTYNYLYSTHSTKFRGWGINLGAVVSSHTQLGLGVERIYCPYHYDNGLNLSNLHLTPIYGMVRYDFWGSRILQPYAKAAVGITLMSYKEQKAGTSQLAVDRKVTGLYTYGALGLRTSIAKRFELFLEMGMVGYKMSFRALDINPHGVTGKTGLLFNL